MNNNKHIHDEDYDFSIKLMVPLLTILVCTICLCATTWAWYTASVSTGINTITSGVNAQVIATVDGLPADIQNGAFIVNSGKTLDLSFTGKEAENGYYALISIVDAPDTPSGNSLFALLVNRIYAEGETCSPIKKSVYFEKNSTKELSITNNYSSPKQVSLIIVWADLGINENGESTHKLNTDLYSDYSDEFSGETLSLQPSRSLITINYLDTEENPLPASVLGIETYGLRDNLEEEPAIISFETEESEITVTAPEGYLLQKDSNFNEETDVPYRTYQIELGEEIEIDVICVKIEEEPAAPNISEEENQEVDEVVEAPKETEPVEVTYAYTVNCIDTDSYTLINSFTGESVLGEITIDIPLIDGYVADSDTTVIKVTENTEVNIFTVQYKKLYSYEIHYVDDDNNILETVSNQTTLDKVEVPLKQFDNKELVLLDGETADTTVRLFDINKELETNIFEIRYTTIVPSENIEPLQEEQLSSN